MAKYIDAEKFKHDLIDNRSFFPAIVARAIEDMPAANVVEVVRCKDCSVWERREDDLIKCPYCFDLKEDNDFCSYGETRQV